MVTQATWQDVWLSEGFATWLSTKVMDDEETAARKGLTAVAARETDHDCGCFAAHAAGATRDEQSRRYG
jgi:aminopeptidase N